VPVGRGNLHTLGALKESRIGIDVVAVVCEGGISDAEGVEEAEVRDRVADLMETFDGEGGDELASSEGSEGGGAVGGW